MSDELVPTNKAESETGTYKLDQKLLNEIVTDLKMNWLVNNKQLSGEVQEVLGDQNFHQYYEAYSRIKKWAQKHPEKYKRYESLGDTGEEETAKLVETYRKEPSYAEWGQLSRQEIKALLKFQKVQGGKRHVIAAEYADRAKIIFPELLRRK